jgi:hypothetical protein
MNRETKESYREELQALQAGTRARLKAAGD